jgi:lipopolysaccharide/colanic/teichoic acid biosynthesis glycosyltransferase
MILLKKESRYEKLRFRSWDNLPDYIKNDSVKKYYDILYKKRKSLFFKRIFDIVASILSILVLLPVFLIIGIIIMLDSKGPIIFSQIRVTQYGRHFKIYKFRTMINNADKIGNQVTTQNDSRVTKIGKVLRKLRLDEIPQLFNIIKGDMSLVGTRPEVVKYVDRYSDEMLATLLLPSGVTSEASIHFKDEELLLVNAKNTDDVYVNRVLPEKMHYNLRSIEEYSFCTDIKILYKTIVAVTKKGENPSGIDIINRTTNNK